MKRILVLACLALVTLGIASAQQPILSFTSKLPFSVGNTNLPAGTYQISALGNSDLGTFQCSNASTGTSVLFEADTVENPPTATGVTFAKYGDKLVLKRFGTNGGLGFFIPISMPEKQVKKPGVKPTKVTTPAN